jgi:hypothetical protein
MIKEFSHYDNRPGIEVILSNGVETISIFYIVYEWPSATKFYDMLTTAINNNYSLSSDTSFNVTIEDEVNLLRRINDLVELINQKYNINIAVITPESDLNILHRETAQVNCELWSPINDSIHAYEQYKIQINNEPRVNAYFRYDPRQSIPLETEDYFFFKADRDFGDLCLNYTHKGKHWLELQSDGDLSSLTDGQLQPETHIEADAYLVFRPPSPSPFFRLNRFINWFKESCPDKKLTTDMAIGYLLLGKLVMPSDWNNFYVPERSDWTRFLCRYKTIVDVKLLTITSDMVPQLLRQARMDYV